MLLTLPRTRGISSGRPVIDYSSPLSKGLAFLAYPGGSQRLDLVGGGGGTLVGNASWQGAMPSGHAFRSNSNTGAMATWAFPERLLDLKNEITILIRADFTNIPTNTGSRLITLPYGPTWTTPFQTFSFGRVRSSSSSTRSTFAFADSATTQITRDNTSVEGDILVTDPVSLYGVVRRGATLNFVKNHRFFAATSSPGSANFAFGSTKEALSLFNVAGDNVRGFTGSCDFAAIWSRALSKEEVAQINSNPYVLLRGTPVLFGIAAAPAGSSGIGSSTLLPPLATGTATSVNRGAALSTLASPLGSGSASVTNKGIASSTLPNPSADGLATVVNRGVAVSALSVPTTTLSGTIVASGQAASALPVPLSAASGTVVARGVANSNISPPISTGEARVVARSHAASSISSPASLATGTVVSQGVASSPLPLPTASGVSTVVAIGVAEATLKLPVSIAFSTPPAGAIAIGDSTLSSPASVAVGRAVKTGLGTSSLTSPSNNANASACAVGAAASTLPTPTATGAGRVVLRGVAASILPAPRTIAVGGPPSNGGENAPHEPYAKLAPELTPIPVGTIPSAPIFYEQPRPSFVATETPPERVLAIRATSRDITIAVASRETLVPRSDRTIGIARIVSKDLDSLPLKEKTPDAVLDYKLDWSQYLAADSDRLIDSEWLLPEGLSIAADKPPSFTSRTTLVWLQGGDINKTYTVLNRVTTVNGRTDTSGFQLKIINYSA